MSAVMVIFERRLLTVQNSEQYEYNGDHNGENIFGCLEEHLKHINLSDSEIQGFQLDLLIPIKEKV